MKHTEKIYQDVISALQEVIDPETGADVIRMRLVLDLNIHEDGTAEYTFRPSSPLCPIALTLVLSIIETVKSVDGVMDQNVRVVDYTGAEALNAILRSLPLAKTNHTTE
jgi:metal-sulfur cluster biosynthetic enzyme